jgi:hypothetical protein
VPLTGVALGVSLPTGLAVASPNGLTNDCGGTVAAIAGSGLVSLSGGSIPVEGSCTFAVDVTPSTSADFIVSTGNVESANGGTGNAAGGTLHVQKLDPALALEAPDSMPLGNATHASATLTGGDPSGTLTFSAFAAGDATCATPLLSDAVAVDGPGTYAGPDFPASAAGAYQWVASYGGDDVHLGKATACDDADGAFAVVAPPSASASFSPQTITAGGSSTLTFTVSNPAENTVPLTGVVLDAALPAGLAIAAPNGLDGSCGGGTITAVPGSHAVSLSGAALPAGDDCTFSVDVTAAGPGDRTVTTDAVQSDNGGEGNAATADLVVEQPKEQEPPPPPPPPPPPGSQPEPPAEQAISNLELLSRCVRPSRAGRVRVRLRVHLAESVPLRVRFQRGVGSSALSKCPEPGAGKPFDGPFKTITTREKSSASLFATAASVDRVVRLKVRLKPGFYRISVRAVLGGGEVSKPQRVFLRVLKR